MIWWVIVSMVVATVLYLAAFRHLWDELSPAERFRGRLIAVAMAVGCLFLVLALYAGIL